MEKRLEQLEATVAALRDNHVIHLQEDVTNLRIEMAGVKIDLQWLKENHWRITIGVALTLISTLVGFLIK